MILTRTNPIIAHTTEEEREWIMDYAAEIWLEHLKAPFGIFSAQFRNTF